VDIGFCASEKIRELLVTEKVSKKQELGLRQEAKAVIVRMIEKVIDKSPLKYSLTRSLKCFDPRRLVDSPDDCRSRFKRVLSTAVNCNRLEARSGDLLIKEYDSYISEVVARKRDEFKDFNIKNDRLDLFFSQNMKGPFPQLFALTVNFLIMSHGQASVERGFSVNKELMSDNMKMDTLVGLRRVHDFVMFHGGILNVSLNKDLMKAAASGRANYMIHLEKQRQERVLTDNQERKKAIGERIQSLKRKKSDLEQEIKSLTTEADEKKGVFWISEI
jgi:hypothetical protein